MSSRFRSNLELRRRGRRDAACPASAPAGAHRGRSRVWLALLLFVTAQPGRADWWEDVLEGRVTAAGATVPIFRQQQRTPVAVLRTGRIHTEWEQRGIFRIGVLPRVVLEDVILDLQPAADVTATMNQLCEQLSSQRLGRCPVELRGFTLRTGTDGRPWLEAATVHFDRQGIWITSVALPRADGQNLTLLRARLTTHEEGEVLLETPLKRYPLNSPEKRADRGVPSCLTPPPAVPP